MFLKTKFGEDPLVIPFGLALQNQVGAIRSLLEEMADQGTRTPLTKPNKVSLMSLFRLRESLNSILLLALNGCVRDANVLLLTLIELKLDVKYIGCDEDRANQWIKHLREETKPWKVAELISKCYPDLSEREAEKDVYRYYSAIKHANPAAGTASFPLGVSDNWLVLDNKENITNLISIVLFATGMEGFEIIDTAIETFISNHIFLNALKDSITTSQNALTRLNIEHIRQMVNELLQRDLKQ